jgi:hypothetical protein
MVRPTVTGIGVAIIIHYTVRLLNLVGEERQEAHAVMMPDCESEAELLPLLHILLPAVHHRAGYELVMSHGRLLQQQQTQTAAHEDARGKRFLGGSVRGLHPKILLIASKPQTVRELPITVHQRWLVRK